MAKKSNSKLLTCLYPENTPLWKRGDRGDFMNVLITKIPPNLPLPKGGIYGIFMPLCEP